MSVVDRVIRVVTALSEVLYLAGIWIFVPVLTALVVYSVALRFVFNMGIMEAMEAEEYLLLLIFMTGLPYCTAKQNHIVLDVLYVRLPRRAKIACDILTGVCGGVFFGLLSLRALVMSYDMYRYGDAGQFFQVPHWPIGLVIALSALVVAIQFPLMALSSALKGEPARKEALL